jgi:hypothetical protein
MDQDIAAATEWEWINGPVQSRRKRIPARQWEDHRFEIEEEFRCGGLPHVQKHMWDSHRFAPE